MALILSKRAREKQLLQSGEDLSSYDPIYFIENHLKLSNHNSFILRQKQLQLLTALNDDKLIVCKQDRRVGVSIATVAYALWYAQHHSNTMTLFVLPTVAYAENLRDQLLELYGLQTAASGASMTFYNRAEVRFDTGSRIRFSYLHDHVATGYLANLIVLGDLTLCDSSETKAAMKSVFPAIASDGRLLAHGHPTDVSHFFYDLWEMTNTGLSTLSGRVIYPLDLGGAFA